MISSSKEIDFDRLRTLLSSDTLVKKYIEKFIDHTPIHFMQLCNAIKEYNLEGIKVAAHSLRTQFEYLNHIRAIEMLRYFEDVVDKESIKGDRVELRLSEFEHIFSQTLTEMKKRNKDMS